MIFDKESAAKFLEKSKLFYDDDDDDHELNMNDTFGWAMSFGQEVKDEDLCEVAELFWNYGNCGILYWVSRINEGMRSEFPLMNRHIDFVKKEEDIRARTKSRSAHAYKKVKYKIGG